MPSPKKTPTASQAQMTEMVLPNDTNTLGNLMGGRLLYWMDIVAAIAASRHSNRVCVTVSVDNVDFKSSILLGEIIILQAKVTRAYTTSMEVRIEVFAENMHTGQRRQSNTAYYTFVAVDQNGRPIPVPVLEPETEAEKREYVDALKRRELRLLLAGRLTNDEAQYVKLNLGAGSAP